MAILEQHRVSPEQFEQLVAPLLGLAVSHPWRGAGSAIFLELGRLKRIPRAIRPGYHVKGIATVMIEWSWRVERCRSIDFGSWNTDRVINNGIARLKHLKVKSIGLDGRIPELCLSLSGNRWLRSFMTTDSQPQWVLFLPDGSWLTVQRGTVIREVAG